MGVAMVSRLMSFLAGLLAVCLIAGIALAQRPPVPLVTGPQDAGQLNSTLNGIIRQINAILVPIFPSPSGSVNYVSLTGALTGRTATIGLAAGADTNAAIAINPNGSGNIILFSTGTGNLQFANSAAFVKAKGLSPCPAVVGGAPFGVARTVTGHLIVQDWLGVKHGIPAC